MGRIIDPDTPQRTLFVSGQDWRVSKAGEIPGSEGNIFEAVRFNGKNEPIDAGYLLRPDASSAHPWLYVSGPDAEGLKAQLPAKTFGEKFRRLAQNLFNW